MPKLRPERKDELASIIDIVRKSPTGARRSDIEGVLHGVPQRTLQFWLRSLVNDGRLIQEGRGPAARYQIAAPVEAQPKPTTDQPAVEEEKLPDVDIPVSDKSKQTREYLRQPVEARKHVGYNRQFLDSYRPNTTFYLSPQERSHLAEVGATKTGIEPAGTYAKQILSRLLIDLSWNSSRLEGNTYSLLDTRRLIEFGEEAQDGNRLEAQMILNHKDAIEFLVSEADEIAFNRYTILNLHGILAQNLLADETAAGRLRRIGVGIQQSAFHPLEVPQLIEECFDQVLATAQAIRDPYEQALFAMVQLPYLQPFDDVNKRVSRLAANIPFIKGNLSPLSFNEVPRSAYTEAILGVYELNKVDLLKDVFIWAYEKSAERYVAVRQSLGEPDPFRLRHHQALRQLEGEVVRGRLGRKEAAVFIGDWVNKNVAEDKRDTFREMVESDLLGLHEGNFARLQIRPSEFKAWQVVWENKELIFPVRDEQYDRSRESVVFWGQDRAQRVRCLISREALNDHFQGDHKDKLDVFRANRQRIEEIARNKYLAGHIEPDGSVQIRTTDL
jgi:hypothetical protein